MSGPWGKSSIGNWAAEAEAEEAAAAAAAAAPAADAQSFPSLREAATAKPKKKKMTLSEFHTAPAGSGGGGARLTPDEMMRLPTGPKERSAEEMQFGRLGGGFSSYGRDRGGAPPNRREDGDGGSWGGGGGGRRSYGGGFDDDRRGSSPRVSDFDQISRADEADNWASAKKAPPLFDSGRQNQNRYSSLGGGGGYGSRADDVDNWAMGKNPLPATARSSTFGSGFRDSGPEPDRWSRGGGATREPERARERPRLVLDQRKGDAGVSVNEPGKGGKANPFGAARPREEVLAEKGLDWKKLESDLEAKKATSRPTSAHSSRPSSAQSSRSESQGLHGVENVMRPKAKVNPFGDAKPREVLLEEKGLDWRKIDLDLEHRAIERPETEEEKLLKDELDDLKKQLEVEPNLQEIVLQKEKELELLIRDLDDKVRFGQKAVDRPGSGAGRAGGFVDRPPSQSGSHEESRNIEYVDRPRSRGTGDAWARPGEDRRGFQGGRERGFLGNRDMDRPRSRERW